MEHGEILILLCHIFRTRDVLIISWVAVFDIELEPWSVSHLGIVASQPVLDLLEDSLFPHLPITVVFKVDELLGGTFD